MDEAGPRDPIDAGTGRLLAWVPGRLRNPLNRGKGEHWAATARDRKAWRERTALCCRDAMNRARWPHGPLRGALVVLTAHVWNLYDEDGLPAALKSVLDGLCDARLLSGDGPKAGQQITRRQLIDRRRRGVEIVVELGASTTMEAPVRQATRP